MFVEVGLVGLERDLMRRSGREACPISRVRLGFQ